jgi:hypothetical protein
VLHIIHLCKVFFNLVRSGDTSKMVLSITAHMELALSPDILGFCSVGQNENGSEFTWAIKHPHFPASQAWSPQQILFIVDEVRMYFPSDYVSLLCIECEEDEMTHTQGNKIKANTNFSWHVLFSVYVNIANWFDSSQRLLPLNEKKIKGDSKMATRGMKQKACFLK